MKETTSNAAQLISIPHIFDKAQRSIANHKKCLTNFTKLQQKDPELFTKEFIYELRRSLTVQKKEASVERVVSLAVQFAVQTPFPAHFEEVQQPFAMLLLSFMLQLADSKKPCCSLPFHSTRCFSHPLHA